ncbi:MAG TPA: DUF6677 family protein [Phycisphaerales bacterium]|nr:DUF6677 family protein [Phycisphaerales bacterium]
MFQPVALLLAVLLPGAGHWYLGETRRALLIACGVLGLFFGGLLIGGIDVVDRRQDFIWFLGQGLVGPLAFGVDALHQNQLKVLDPVTNLPRSPRPSETRDPVTGKARPAPAAGRPPVSKSIGRVNEMGTLFSAIAGMMNLIVVLDASVYRARRVRPGRMEPL